MKTQSNLNCSRDVTILVLLKTVEYTGNLLLLLAIYSKSQGHRHRIISGKIPWKQKNNVDKNKSEEQDLRTIRTLCNLKLDWTCAPEL